MSLSNSRPLPLFRRCLVAGVLLLALSGAWAFTTQAPTQEAEALLDDYFTALKTGDLGLLQSSLGGSLRTKREGLLQNPDYSFELLQSYSDAEFVIVGYDLLGSGSIEAIIEIVVDNERVRHRLLLAPIAANGGLRIVDSELIP
jgi:hypothetical protein